MINLMLDKAANDSITSELNLVAVEIESLHSSESRSQDGPVTVGNGQAALLKLPLTTPLNDLRVDHHSWAQFVLCVKDCHTAWNTDLVGRETQTRSVVHGLDHVPDQTAHGGVNINDWLRLHPEDRIAKRSNRIGSHLLSGSREGPGEAA